jgi:hypothetical protein
MNDIDKAVQFFSVGNRKNTLLNIYDVCHLSLMSGKAVGYTCYIDDAIWSEFRSRSSSLRSKNKKSMQRSWERFKQAVRKWSFYNGDYRLSSSGDIFDEGTKASNDILGVKLDFNIVRKITDKVFEDKNDTKD